MAEVKQTAYQQKCHHRSRVAPVQRTRLQDKTKVTPEHVLKLKMMIFICLGVARVKYMYFQYTKSFHEHDGFHVHAFHSCIPQIQSSGRHFV